MQIFQVQKNSQQTVFQAFRLVNVLQVTESIPKGLYNKDKKSHMICSASGITIDDGLDVDDQLII